MVGSKWLCLTAGLLLAPPSSAGAQEATAWLAQPAFQSVRVLGLGGAYAGLADDSSSVVLNPAGLTTLPRSLEALGALGVDYDSSVGLGGASGAFRPERRLGVGFQYSYVDGQEMQSTRATSGLPSAGLQDVALGAAVTITGPGEFSAGATLRLTRLSAVHLTEEPWSRSFTAGVLFRPLNPWSPRIGLSYRHRLEWEAAGANDPDPHLIVSPSVLSAGVSWYYEPEQRARLLFTLQPDYVRYSDLTRGAPMSAQARNEIDLRAGVELTRPFGCWTGCGSMFQIRGAIVNSAPAPFVVRATSVGEGVGQGPERRWTWAGGVAMGLDAGYGRFKVEASWDQRSETIAFGVGWRFPQSFRAGIVDDTRRRGQEP
ncbi:MAG: hypothetical protein LJF30_12000 [Acidobacteria bacterium]|jgi:hypothetical protein|nr:hypothetical protein [Acidobacteriota bacterium]